MKESRETVYASEPMSVQNSIQPRVAIRDIATTRSEAYNIYSTTLVHIVTNPIYDITQ